jgi:hypothetical protein
VRRQRIHNKDRIRARKTARPEIVKRGCAPRTRGRGDPCTQY